MHDKLRPEQLGEKPSWAPDACLLLYCTGSDHSTGDLQIYHPTDGRREPVGRCVAGTPAAWISSRYVCYIAPAETGGVYQLYDRESGRRQALPLRTSIPDRGPGISISAQTSPTLSVAMTAIPSGTAHQVVYRYDLATHKLNRVAPGVLAALSPVDSRIAFATPGPNARVFLAQAPDWSPRPIASGVWDVANLLWSPDGALLAVGTLRSRRGADPTLGTWLYKVR